MAKEIHLNDVNTVFRITLMDGAAIVPLDTATVMRIKFTKPTVPETVVVVTAVLSTDGLDGRLQYLTVFEDLDTIGKWKIQAYVESPSWSGHSDTGSFKVYRNLDTPQ